MAAQQALEQAYPVYKGKVKLAEFTRFCIQLFEMRNNGPHKIMWDDWIVRRATDYRTYYGQRLADDLDVKSYKEWFGNLDDVKFTKKIMTSQMLEDIARSQ